MSIYVYILSSDKNECCDGPCQVLFYARISKFRSDSQKILQHQWGCCPIRAILFYILYKLDIMVWISIFVRCCVFTVLQWKTRRAGPVLQTQTILIHLQLAYFVSFSLFICTTVCMPKPSLLVESWKEPRSCNSRAVKRRHMGTYVGGSLGNRLHSHSCVLRMQRMLWIQGVSIQPSSASL